MIKVKETKALAREALKGKYGSFIGAQILRFIVTLVLAAAAVSSLVAAVVYADNGGVDHSGYITIIIVGSILFTVFLFLTVIVYIFTGIGMHKLALSAMSGQKYGAGNIFYGFRSGSHMWRIVGVKIIIGLVTVLYVLVNIVFKLIYDSAGTNSQLMKGMIAAAVVSFLIFNFIMMGWFVADLVILDDPEYRVGAALRESRRIMKGAKLKAFWLRYFSFIFWQVLTSVCPLAGFWVTPYRISSRAVLYLAAKDELYRVPVSSDAGYTDAKPGQANAEPTGASHEEAASQAGIAAAVPAASQAAASPLTAGEVSEAVQTAEVPAALAGASEPAAVYETSETPVPAESGPVSYEVPKEAEENYAPAEEAPAAQEAPDKASENVTEDHASGGDEALAPVAESDSREEVFPEATAREESVSPCASEAQPATGPGPVVADETVPEEPAAEQPAAEPPAADEAEPAPIENEPAEYAPEAETEPIDPGPKAEPLQKETEETI